MEATVEATVVGTETIVINSMERMVASAATCQWEIDESDKKKLQLQGAA